MIVSRYTHVSSTHGRLERLGVSLLGIAGSALLHVAILTGVHFSGYGADLNIKQPDHPGAKPGGIRATAEAPMTVVFLDSPTDRDRGTQELMTLTLSPNHLAVIPGEPDLASLAPKLEPIQVDEEATAEETASGPDPSQQLFGRYEGQITARIERAWIKPRTPIPGDTFVCRVKILQDAKGNVQEATPQLCNGTPRWQQSLVRAIYGASPLPAPPDPTVFSPILTLAFAARPFVPGGSQQGFEVDRPDLVEIAEQEDSAARFQSAVQSLRSKDHSSPAVIDLRLVGTPRRPESSTVSTSPPEVSKDTEP